MRMPMRFLICVTRRLKKIDLNNLYQVTNKPKGELSHASIPEF